MHQFIRPRVKSLMQLRLDCNITGGRGVAVRGSGGGEGGFGDEVEKKREGRDY